MYFLTAELHNKDVIKKLKAKKQTDLQQNKLLMQYTYIMVKKRYVKIRPFYLKPITR
jgi:hypothetical protein